MPAVCRDNTAVGTDSNEAMRIRSPKPGNIVWQAAAVASGVTSGHGRFTSHDDETTGHIRQLDDGRFDASLFVENDSPLGPGDAIHRSRTG